MMKLTSFYLTLLFMGSCVILATDCACQKRLRVGQLLVDRMPSAEGIDLDREELKAIAIKALSENSDFDVDFGRREGTLRLRVRLEPDDETESLGRLVVSLKYSQMGNVTAKQYFGSGSTIVDKQPNSGQAFRVALKEGFVDLISSWRGEEQGVTGLLKTLERYLAGEDVIENRLLQSIHILGIKKEKRAVGLLTKLLSDKDQRIALGALSALTTIADPSAIDAVTQFAERKSPDVRKQCILAARQMGGLRAAAWLFTLSTGHEDPEVRAAASDALRAVEVKLTQALNLLSAQ